MAIARGAGTEIIRSAHFEDIDDQANTILILGVQHHIYTVLSIIIHSSAASAGDKFFLDFVGYDSKAGDTATTMRLLNHAFGGAEETFVWNDKFSFNGYEPTDFTGPLSTAVEQDAIADQGSSVAQKLQCSGEENADSFDVFITFIDQNNN